jgi:hypothetical protein
MHVRTLRMGGIARTFTSPSDLLMLRPNPQRFQRLGQRLRLQHHPLAAAKWPVIHGPMPVMRKAAKIVNAHLDQPLGLRPAHDPVLEDARKKAREDGEDFEPHTSIIEGDLARPIRITADMQAAARLTPRLKSRKLNNCEGCGSSGILAATAFGL